MTRMLPVDQFAKKTIDKASTLKMVIAHIRMRQFCEGGDESYWSSDHDGDISASDIVSELLHCLDGFVLVILKSGKIIYATETVANYLGFAQLDMIGRKIFEYIHPEDKSELETILHHLEFFSLNLQGMQKVPVKFSIRMKCILSTRKAGYLVDGCKIMHCSGYLKCRGILENDQEDSTSWKSNVSGLVVLCRTLPYTVGAGIRLSPRMFMFRMGLDLLISHADNEVFFQTGYTPSQLHGKSLYNFIHPMHLQQIQRDHSSLQEKDQVISKYYVFLVKGGGWVWLQTFFTVMKTGMKSCDYIIATNQVISEHVQSKLILEEEQLGVLTPCLKFIKYGKKYPFSSLPIVSKSDNSLVRKKCNNQHAKSKKADNFVTTASDNSKHTDFFQENNLVNTQHNVTGSSQSGYCEPNYESNSHHLQDLSNFNQAYKSTSITSFPMSNIHHNVLDNSQTFDSAQCYGQKNYDGTSDNSPEYYSITDAIKSRLVSSTEFISCHENEREESTSRETTEEYGDDSQSPTELFSSEKSSEAEYFDGTAKKRFCSGIQKNGSILQTLLTKPPERSYKCSKTLHQDCILTSDTDHIPEQSKTKSNGEFSSAIINMNPDKRSLTTINESNKYHKSKSMSPVDLTFSHATSPEKLSSTQDNLENPFFYSKETVDRLKEKDVTYNSGKFIFANCPKLNFDTRTELYHDNQSPLSTTTELDLENLPMHSTVQDENSSSMENTDNSTVKSRFNSVYIPRTTEEPPSFIRENVQRGYKHPARENTYNDFISKEINETEVNNNRFSKNEYCPFNNSTTDNGNVNSEVDSIQNLGNKLMAGDNKLSKDIVNDNKMLNKLKMTYFPTNGNNSLPPFENFNRKFQRQCSVPLDFSSNLVTDRTVKFQRQLSEPQVFPSTSSNSVDKCQNFKTDLLSSSLESEFSYCISNENYSSPSFRDDFSEIELISTDSDPENLFSSLTFTENVQLVSGLPTASSSNTNDQRQLLEDVFLL